MILKKKNLNEFLIAQRKSSLLKRIVKSISNARKLKDDRLKIQTEVEQFSHFLKKLKKIHFFKKNFEPF